MIDAAGVELHAGDAIAYVADSGIKFGRVYEIKSKRTGGAGGGSWWVTEACMVSGVKAPYRLIDGNGDDQSKGWRLARARGRLVHGTGILRIPPRSLPLGAFKLLFPEGEPAAMPATYDGLLAEQQALTLRLVLIDAALERAS